MKRTLVVLILSVSLVGCASAPKKYGNIKDYSEYDTEDFHVKYAVGEDGCYSDGSYGSNMMYDSWVNDYKETH